MGLIILPLVYTSGIQDRQMCQWPYVSSVPVVICSDSSLHLPGLPLIGHYLPPTYAIINIGISLHGGCSGCAMLHRYLAGGHGGDGWVFGKKPSCEWRYRSAPLRARGHRHVWLPARWRLIRGPGGRHLTPVARPWAHGHGGTIASSQRAQTVRVGWLLTRSIPIASSVVLNFSFFVRSELVNAGEAGCVCVVMPCWNLRSSLRRERFLQ